MKPDSPPPPPQEPANASQQVGTGAGSKPDHELHLVIPAYNPGPRVLDVVESARHLVDTVVLVDDGCDAENRRYLKRCEDAPNVTLLSHPSNRGKGFALMTGIKRCLHQMRPQDFVLTLDSDGQHNPADIARFRQLLAEGREVHLVLGERLDQQAMPFKSRLGNRFAAAFFRLQTGVAIRDTQTGFRLLSQPFAQSVLGALGGGLYETEMEMLILAAQSLPRIDSVEIETIYFDGNAATRFRAVADSWRVLARLARYGITGVASFLIDYLLFLLLSYVLSVPYLVANVAARVVSAAANFLGHQTFSFRSPGRTATKAIRYLAAVAFSLTLASALLLLTVEGLAMEGFIAKPLVDGLVFFINFTVLSRFVFALRKPRR